MCNSITVECLYSLFGTSSLEVSINEPSTSPVNILNVEIKTRNIPFVLSHFHTPEDEWAILSVEWVLVADNLPL